VSRLRLLVGVALGALVLSGQLAAVSDAPLASSQRVLVRYTGRLDTSWEPIMKQPDGRNYHVARYLWTLSWRGPVSQLVARPSQKMRVEKLRGTVKYVDNTSAEHADCDGGFAARVKTIPMTASVNTGQGTILFSPRFPVSTEFLRPTNTTSLHEFCGEVVWWGLPDRYRLPAYQVRLRQKGDSRSIDRSLGPKGTNREHAVLSETFSLKIVG
jgi:hypothetical protein